MSAADSEWQQLENLGRSTVAGAPSAYEQFWVALAPEVERWLAQPKFLGKVCEQPEWQRDILVTVWEKLQDRDHAKLRAYFRMERRVSAGKQHPFRGWVRTVVKNTGIDFMRGLPEYIRGRKPRMRASVTGAPSEVKHWRSITGLKTGGAGQRDPVTVADAARRMLDFLDENVPQRLRRVAELFAEGKSPEEIARALRLKDGATAERAVCRAHDRLAYRQAVELWSQGYTETEIAEALDFDSAKHSRRVLNAAKELLRRHFKE